MWRDWNKNFLITALVLLILLILLIPYYVRGG
jgi:hypothetical protein